MIAKETKTTAGKFPFTAQRSPFSSPRLAGYAPALAKAVGSAPSRVQAISNLARNLIDNDEALADAGAYRAYLGLLDGDCCAVIGHF